MRNEATARRHSWIGLAGWGRGGVRAGTRDRNGLQRLGSGNERRADGGCPFDVTHSGKNRLERGIRRGGVVKPLGHVRADAALEPAIEFGWQASRTMELLGANTSFHLRANIRFIEQVTHCPRLGG